MQHKCPHCGAALPEGAAFCPHCAKDVHPRKDTGTPTPLRKKALLGLLALAVVLAAGLGIWYANRPYVPQEFDGVGEVYYESGDKTYQLLVAWPNDRCMPAPDIYQQGAPDEQYRWPSRWYVNDAATGADAWPEFEPLVEQVTVEVVQDENAADPLVAGEPSHREDYSPDAAMVSSLDFTGSSGEPQVVWTIQMKNGDMIRVRQNIHISLILTHEYHWQDYPMNTLEELQSLMDDIAAQVNPADEVILYLPPVTYEGDLELCRSFEFHGNTDGAERTVLKGSLTMLETGGYYWINYFYDLDFMGDGTNTGITALSKAWAIGCSFTGYKNGLLTQGGAWVNVTECTFADNEVGLFYNSTGQSVSDDRFFDNTFTDNGTAVLLMSVPTDLTLYFDGTTFSGNGVNVDNRCGHSVDLSRAVGAE